MKIVVSGSLGHISKPLAIALMQKGHSVTVISSHPERKKDIEALGATAVIGTMKDVDFLTSAFMGADAVYCMLTAGNFFDHSFDLMAECRAIANNYKQAILKAGVKRVVHLSSIGAHMDGGNGILRFHYIVENILRELPSDVAIKHLRPVGFYYNMLAFIPTIKTQGMIISNYGDISEPWVSPTDIAAVAAEEITSPFDGRQIRYIASEELTTGEVAGILGAAIGKPDLKWLAIPDEQILQGMIAVGMNPTIAAGVVEMNASRRTKLYEDYYRNRPILGNVKVRDYAKEFADTYNKQ
jgi:uncharacterized protein YbjT (DUF2867 family)